MGELRFITKHGLVLLCIAKNRGKTAREIGDEVGVTERTAHKMILDLEAEGYITKAKAGNKNTYRVRPEVPIKAADVAVGELLEMLGWKRRGRKTAEASNKPESKGG
ncbi:MAG: winged helix-turn-helix transcriptional regulator [Chloroflexi bacterium]|nr:winged helix-turn-helix transcriptional regulator [Chloroflexota bacterium]